MEVSKVSLVEKTVLTDKRIYPTTFYSLTAPERRDYNTFQQVHRDLEAVIHQLSPTERKERSIPSGFFASPYIKSTLLPKSVPSNPSKHVVSCVVGNIDTSLRLPDS